MKTYSISEIAAKYNVTVATLRYYDDSGLLPFVKRNGAGQRVFTDDDLGYLEVIDCLKRSAIPLKAIRKFMDWCMMGDTTLPERFDFMVEQETLLEQKIAVLQANLAFLHWKKWYYEHAKDAGTEAVFWIPGTHIVDPKWRAQYVATTETEKAD
ncbi:MerR family transcriptional regulator [uncultured Secundilactobacillus sp.]|uniref:MerR family transcriptional regulator n=1 Tax=uncultured Secundilactobacillus sp. TaxID=2813935 RepID=UPI00258E1A58|nr:MerR family transcriptional regulator [uncultured Secundilactobacillus sp.]